MATTIGQMMQRFNVNSAPSSTQSISKGCTTLSPRAKACIERYGDADQFLITFSPDKQCAYTTDLRRVYMGNAPTLGTVRIAYGKEKAMLWIEAELVNLSEFTGARDKLTPFQLDELSQMIIAEWGYFKVTELMLFFRQLKSGKYGRFYGSVDSMVIAEALRMYADERWAAIDRYEKEEQKRIEKENEEASQIMADAFSAHLRRCRMTPQEYFDISERYGLSPDEMEAIGWLYNMGYEPEQVARAKIEAAKVKTAQAKRKADLDAMIAELQRQRAALDR